MKTLIFVEVGLVILHGIDVVNVRMGWREIATVDEMPNFALFERFLLLLLCYLDILRIEILILLGS